MPTSITYECKTSLITAFALSPECKSEDKTSGDIIFKTAKLKITPACFIPTRIYT